jgi:hypothetical protein
MFLTYNDLYSFNNGDNVAYPCRRGPKVWFNCGIIESIDENGILIKPYFSRGLVYLDKRRVRIKIVKNLIKIQGNAYAR